jgi:hypothetical protein
MTKLTPLEVRAKAIQYTHLISSTQLPESVSDRWHDLACNDVFGHMHQLEDGDYELVPNWSELLDVYTAIVSAGHVDTLVASNPNDPNADDDKIQALIEFVEQHLGDPKNVDDMLTHMCGVHHILERSPDLRPLMESGMLAIEFYQ